MMKLYAAPLQGFTEAPWRNAHQAIFGGIDTYYTPFVRTEKEEFRNKDLRDIDPDINTVSHLVPQLIAATPGEINQLLGLFIEKGYKEADINMGCPFPLMTRKHKGSGILPYPSEVKALMDELAHYPDMQFSVKMRLGWSYSDEWKAVLSLLNHAPLQRITLHPRIGRQQYNGSVCKDGFTAFYEACEHPLVYNGDVLSVEDIQQLTEDYPNLEGIMLGRGLLARPSLAIEYREGVRLSEEELYIKVRELHSQLYQYYEGYLQGEAQLLNKMKTCWEYLLPDMDKKLRKVIIKSMRVDKYLAAVDALFDGE